MCAQAGEAGASFAWCANAACGARSQGETEGEREAEAGPRGELASRPEAEDRAGASERPLDAVGAGGGSKDELGAPSPDPDARERR
jgi:hypothetical protein